MLFFGEDRILEKRSSAAAIRVSFNDEHPLTSSNLADRLAGLAKVRTSFLSLEVSFQIRVVELWDDLLDRERRSRAG